MDDPPDIKHLIPVRETQNPDTSRAILVGGIYQHASKEHLLYVFTVHQRTGIIFPVSQEIRYYSTHDYIIFSKESGLDKNIMIELDIPIPIQLNYIGKHIITLPKEITDGVSKLFKQLPYRKLNTSNVHFRLKEAEKFLA